jgi:hypothetical protein
MDDGGSRAITKAATGRPAFAVADFVIANPPTSAGEIERVDEPYAQPHRLPVREDPNMRNQFQPLRMVFIAIVVVLVVVMVSYLNGTVGVNHSFSPPRLTRDETLRYVPLAVASVLLVILVDVAVAGLALRKIRREQAEG